LLNKDKKIEILKASSIPISKLEKAQPYIIGLILFIGFSLDIFSCKLLAFPRSGALVVCLGIVIGLKLYAITTFSQDEVYQAICTGRDKLRQAYIDATGKVSLPQASIPNADELYEESKSALEKSFGETKNRIIKLEMITLVVGTIVWGFGDIITVLRCSV
jgi:hypothetical protein